jgi:hypothetical protein
LLNENGEAVVGRRAPVDADGRFDPGEIPDLTEPTEETTMTTRRTAVLRMVTAGLLLAPMALMGACDDEDDPVDPTPEAPAAYAVEVEGEEFVVRVASDEQVAQMEERLASGEPGVINGLLESGDGGFNDPWSWHMVPESVETPDVAVEVCDGTPSFVEQDLDYWLNTVERYCPWGAVVTERLQE